MDFYGMTLRKLLTKSQTVQNLKNMTKELISGLKYLTLNNVFHGNLSPDVILVEKVSNTTTLIISGYECLKFKELDKNSEYIPLNEELDEKFDVYSLGIIVYQMLTNNFKPIREFIEKDEKFILKSLSKKDPLLVEFIYQSTKLNKNERSSVDELSKIFENESNLETILKSKKSSLEKIEETLRKKKGFVTDRYMNPMTFEGNQFVDFILREFLITIEESINLGNLMISQGLMNPTQSMNSFKNDSSLYRFTNDEKSINFEEISLKKKGNEHDDDPLVSNLNGLLEKHKFVAIIFFRGIW
jgi:serine/threonine protein kinase